MKCFAQSARRGHLFVVAVAMATLFTFASFSQAKAAPPNPAEGTGQNALEQVAPDGQIGQNALEQVAPDGQIGQNALEQVAPDGQIGQNALEQVAPDGQIGQNAGANPVINGNVVQTTIVNAGLGVSDVRDPPEVLVKSVLVSITNPSEAAD